ncbi:MAG: hypothetical protein ACRC10_07175 [Thermoguttaceae bacterium]
MKKISVPAFVVFLILSFGPSLGLAQNNPTEKDRKSERAMLLKMQTRGAKQALKSIWDGNSGNVMAFQMLQKDDFREGVGVSKEQLQNIGNVLQNIGNDPEMKQFEVELQKVVAAPDGQAFDTISEEAQNKMFDLQTKIQNVVMQKLSKTVNETLSPEQLKKIQEGQIAIMGELPVISPNMFEALGLSDDQRTQLNRVKEGLQPEFDKHASRFTDFLAKMMEKLQDEMERRSEGVTDIGDHVKILEDARKAIFAADPDLQREMKEVMEAGTTFSNELKFKMYDVLTDEQIERMRQLIDNPPPYIKKMIDDIRKELGNDGEWKPGMNSWKPGDPIPEEYLRERKDRQKRFPSSSAP